MPLTQDRLIKRRDAHQFSDPVAANTTIFTGALVVLDAAGNAAPASAATNLTARGVCTERADNTGGAAGDVSVDVRAGCYNFKNSSGADEIDRSNIGGVAWIVDDETVAATDGGASRSPAGRIEDVNADGVWVDVGSLSLTVEVTGA